jgi:hypothetical protein
MKYQGPRRIVSAALVALAILAAPLPTLAGGSTRLRSHSPEPAGGERTAPVDRSTELGFELEQAIYDLHARWARGESFALEEAELINRFVGRHDLTRLEADVLVSRILHTVYVTGDRPSDEHAALLEAYLARLAEEGREVADVRVGRELEAGYKAAATESVAAPPNNDECAGAVVIPGAGPFPFLSSVVNVADATTAGDPPTPSCFADISRSVWYRFTPSVTAFYRLTTCADAPTATTLDDSRIAIYTSSGGCAGPFTELPTAAGATDGCGEDGCNSEAGQAEVLTQLTSGTEYFVVIWKSGQPAPLPANSSVQLRVERNLAPANDTCAGPSPITLNIPLAGTTVGATNDYELAAGSACFTGIGQVATTAPGRDTVHAFTAPSAGTYSIRASGPTNNDSNIVIYTASSCPTATPGVPVNVACTAASSQNNSRAEQVVLALSSGQQVFVFVDDTAAGGAYFGTSYQVEVTLAVSETESNNTTGTADPLSCGLDLGISPATDVDFFSLGTPAAGSRVFALLDGATVSATDIDMRVTTTTDTLERDRANADGLFGSNTPAIAGTPLTGVASFLRINKDEANQERAPYRLYSVVQPNLFSATVETEPNNTIGSSDGATSNYFFGSLALPAPSTDVDVYRTPANAGELLFVALDCDPVRDNTPIQAKMALLDSSGNVLIEVSDGATTSSTTSGAGSLTSTTPFSPAEAFVYRAPAAGTYYVRVEIDTTSTAGLGAGDYLLSISRGCQTGGGTTATGGGTDTPGIYIPASGAWFLRNSSSSGPADVVFTYGGGGALVPITGDWNGDGIDTPGLYDPASGAFFLRNSNTPGPADLVFTFGGGGAGIVPITGDWNGDGTDTIGLYITASGTFFLRNTNTPGNADLTFTFGAGGAGVLPVTGDWNADGADTIGIYIASSGTFFLRNANGPGAADLTFNFGPGNATPLTGDWNGDGIETIGIYIAGTGTFFLRNTNTPGNADLTFTFGGPNNTPLTGDWNGQ